MTKYYFIAGLRVEINGEDTLQRIADLPGFEVFELNRPPEKAIDIRILADQTVERSHYSDLRSIHQFEVSDVLHSFSVCREGYLFEMHHLDGSRILALCYLPKERKVILSPAEHTDSIKFATWVAFALPAIDARILPIHASVIVKENAAVLFLGKSGTGKSTHTRLWLKHIADSYLLNDDSPLLRVKGDQVFACGSPWSGKTHCYRQEAIPVKALVRLEQYPENIIKELKALVAIGAVQPSFPPIFAYDEELVEKEMQIMDSIIGKVPVFHLKCLPDQQAAKAAYTAIYG